MTGVRALYFIVLLSSSFKDFVECEDEKDSFVALVLDYEPRVSSSIMFNGISRFSVSFSWPCLKSVANLTLTKVGGDECYTCQLNYMSKILDQDVCSFESEKTLCPDSLYAISLSFTSLGIVYEDTFVTLPGNNQEGVPGGIARPTILTTTSTTSNITLLWAKPNCPTLSKYTYAVYVSNGFAFESYDAGTDTLFDITKLQPGTEYQINIKACSYHPGIWACMLSAPVKIKTKDDTSILQVQYTLVNESTLEIFWTVHPNIDQLNTTTRVECSKEAGEGIFVEADDPINMTHTCGGLQANSEYQVTVRLLLIDEYGFVNGTLSSETISATTNRHHGKPVITHNQSLNSTTVELKWVRSKYPVVVNDYSEFMVKLFVVSSDGQETLLKNAITTEQQILFGDLNPNTLHKFEVITKSTYNNIATEQSTSQPVIGYIKTMEAVPPETVQRLLLISVGSTSVEFFVPDHLFSHEFGDILGYPVIVGIREKLENSIGQGVVDDLLNIYWNENRPPIYKASQKKWNPYTDNPKDGTFNCKPYLFERGLPGRSCILGSGKCYVHGSVCNGPLNETTEYG